MIRSEDHKGLILAGDIGGTKTNLGLFVRGKRRPLMRVMETYPSRQSPGLERIISRFLEEHPATVSAACFGVAGPVQNGRCRTTNLPWDVSELRIRNRFKWPHVLLINDLTAAARAVPLLNRKELFSLNRAKARKGRNIALVAPGTGLGQALLVGQGGHSLPVSSEGGHADFAPTGKREAQLWEYLRGRFGHVSLERVLSGPGLLNIYAWLKASGQYKEPPRLARLLRTMDPAGVISDAAIHGRSRICSESLNMFISILGAASGNLALTAMTTGGVYLGGGIAPRILPKLKEGLFMKAFTAKGRFTGLMKKIPVRVILNDKAALLGAAHRAFEASDGITG
jgi:glucokinase